MQAIINFKPSKKLQSTNQETSMDRHRRKKDSQDKYFFNNIDSTIQEIKEDLESLYSDDSYVKIALNQLSSKVFEEILEKYKNIYGEDISNENLAARAIAIHSMNMINQTSDYDHTTDLYQLAKPWKVYTNIYAEGVSLTKLAKPQKNEGLAFSIENNDLKEGLTDLFNPQAINNREIKYNTLDCSLAKQLVNLNAVVHSGKYAASTKLMVVQNESITLLGKIQTIQDYMTQRVIPKEDHEEQERCLIPGDSVYFQNDPYYPSGPSFFFAGEHALYVGSGNYTGFGVPQPTSYLKLKDLLRQAHINAGRDTKKNFTENKITPGYPRLKNQVDSFKF